MKMSVPPQVRNLLQQFEIADGVLLRISQDILREFQEGLAKHKGSSCAMLPTFVPELPDGSEAGKYVAIDLSGKNLRFMLLTLTGDNSTPPQTFNHNYMISQDIMLGTGEQLFNFIVNKLKKFLDEHSVTDQNLPIGFVFSYPCELVSIRSARLLWWTKGFKIEDCLQKDVVLLLEQALSLNMGIKAQVKAVMNDTVGQLAAGAYRYGPDCVAGVVIGYGCNASYMEKVANIGKFDPKARNYQYPNMVVVTEWEEFGKNGELDDILTMFDKEIDAASVHVGKQIVDKLTGALYLGELVRRIADQLTTDGLLFGGQQVEALQTLDGFPSKYISEILTDSLETTKFKNCRRIMEELQIPLHGISDYLILQEICTVVSRRSASIAAAAMAALMEHIKRPKIRICVGGALVQFHPTYLQLLEEKLIFLAPQDVEWEIVPAEEGSAYGAALVAAVADKLKL